MYSSKYSLLRLAPNFCTFLCSNSWHFQDSIDFCISNKSIESMWQSRTIKRGWRSSSSRRVFAHQVQLLPGSRDCSRLFQYMRCICRNRWMNPLPLSSSMTTPVYFGTDGIFHMRSPFCMFQLGMGSRKLQNILGNTLKIRTFHFVLQHHLGTFLACILLIQRIYHNHLSSLHFEQAATLQDNSSNNL